jgi:trehalose 6-phosphate phosphatase
VSGQLPEALEAAVDRLSREPVLLVASDFDGTMAPIVENPEDARPHREAIVALTLLASLPRTHVAVISGRALSDLSAMVGMPGACAPGGQPRQ